jgi:hypothetical protein
MGLVRRADGGGAHESARQLDHEPLSAQTGLP